MWRASTSEKYHYHERVDYRKPMDLLIGRVEIDVATRGPPDFGELPLDVIRKKYLIGLGDLLRRQAVRDGFRAGARAERRAGIEGRDVIVAHREGLHLEANDARTLDRGLHVVLEDEPEVVVQIIHARLRTRDLV